MVRLFAWLIISISVSAGEPQDIPLEAPLHLDCGIYSVTARLGRSKEDRYILSIGYKTTSPIEFIVLTDNPEPLQKRVGSILNVEGYVPAPIISNDRPFIILRKYSEYDGPKEDSLQKIRLAQCHDKSESRR